jgi:hypothetical protein
MVRIVNWPVVAFSVSLLILSVWQSMSFTGCMPTFRLSEAATWGQVIGPFGKGLGEIGELSSQTNLKVVWLG